MDRIDGIPPERANTIIRLFSSLKKLVLDFAVAMSRTPADISEELF